MEKKVLLILWELCQYLFHVLGSKLYPLRLLLGNTETYPGYLETLGQRSKQTTLPTRSKIFKYIESRTRSLIISFFFVHFFYSNSIKVIRLVLVKILRSHDLLWKLVNRRSHNKRNLLVFQTILRVGVAFFYFQYKIRK